MSDKFSLLEPITENDFFTNYFEKKFLHVSRDQPKHFNNVLNLDDIDSLFATGRLFYPVVNTIKAGDKKSVASWLKVQNLDPTIPIDKEELFKAFADGHTITFNTIHLYVPKLKKFLIDLGERWSVSFTSNLYITPANNQGFDWHYDNHDVFVIQLNGSKKWELDKKDPFLPDLNYKRTSPPVNEIEDVESLVLNEGDTLYIPRGTYHRAIAYEKYSVHLTIGVNSVKVYKLLEDILHQAIEQKEFRKSVISNNINPYNVQELTALLTEFVKEQLIINKSEKTTKKLIDSLQESKKSKNYFGRLSSYLELDSLNSNTKIQLSTPTVPQLEVDGSFILIRIFGNEWKYPILLEETLKSILTIETKEVREIKGTTPEKQKLLLVKKLISMGVIKIVQ